MLCFKLTIGHGFLSWSSMMLDRSGALPHKFGACAPSMRSTEELKNILFVCFAFVKFLVSVITAVESNRHSFCAVLLDSHSSLPFGCPRSCRAVLPAPFIPCRFACKWRARFSLQMRGQQRIYSCSQSVSRLCCPKCCPRNCRSKFQLSLV